MLRGGRQEDALAVCVQGRRVRRVQLPRMLMQVVAQDVAHLHLHMGPLNNGEQRETRHDWGRYERQRANLIGADKRVILEALLDLVPAQSGPVVWGGSPSTIIIVYSCTSCAALNADGTNLMSNESLMMYQIAGCPSSFAVFSI